MTSSTRFDVLPLVAIGFGVRALKQWNTHDGGGYTFVLTHNRKAVAEITNDGHGGETSVYWKGLYPNGSADPRTTKSQFKASTEAKKAFDSFVESAPPMTFSTGHSLSVDDGIVLEELLNHSLIVKQCRNATLFCTKDGQELKIKEVYSEDLANWIRSKHPEAVIHNERISQAA